jgi:hypothetical protein
VNDHRFVASVSRRTALAGLGAGGLGLAAISLITMPTSLLAGPATPETTETEADLIREIERERLRSLVEADIEVAEQLHTDDFQLINPSGGVLSKEEYLGAIVSGEIDYLVWEPTSDIAVHLYGDAAAIRYRARIEIVVGGDTLFDRTWHTDVYERRDGRWQVVWSQATRIL